MRGGERVRPVILVATYTLVVMLTTISIIIPPPVSAAEGTMQLNLGGHGSTPWSIAGIKPGDHGTEEVTLQNTGAQNGHIIIWISDIVETDGFNDGFALSDYFVMSLVASGVSTSRLFPLRISEMPVSASGTNKIVIDPLPAHGSIVIQWNWEFRENGQPQNKAQGDGLRFSINYLLAETVPGKEINWLIVEVLGQDKVIALEPDGSVAESVQASDAQGQVLLAFAAGSHIQDEEGTVPTNLVLTIAENASSVLYGTNARAVGPVYRLDAYVEGRLINATFSQDVFMTLGFDETSSLSNLSHGGNIYHLSNGEWSILPHVGSYTSWEARGWFNTTGLFTVGLITIDISQNAFIFASHLAVGSREDTQWWFLPLLITQGRSANVTVVVTNIGGIAGNYTMALVLDGNTADVQLVELGPMENQKIEFEVDGLTEGTHTLFVGGLSDSIHTHTSINWILIFLIILVCAIIYLVWRNGRRTHDRRKRVKR